MKNRKSLPAAHNILENNQWSKSDLLYTKLNCTDKKIKLRRADYPNTDPKFFWYNWSQILSSFNNRTSTQSIWQYHNNHL